MHPYKTRDSTLAIAEENLINARENVKQVAEIIQADCPHRLVFQTHNSSSSPRICPKCGLQVQSHSLALGTSHWTAKDFEKSPLNNHEDRIVVEIEREEFYKLTIKN